VKHIRKGKEPAELRSWRLANKSTPQNLRYQNVPKNALEAIRIALLKEQGFLCGYTMMRVDLRKGHIEHIQAQSLKRDLQISFSNMVYCYPGDGAPHCAFGAHAKDGRAVEARMFVSPLDPTCETRFTYRENGGVSAANGDDEAAKKTIDLLRLDNNVLVQARKAVIRTLPIFSRSKPHISSRRAARLASNVLFRDADGRFQEYAVVLNQVMARYAKRRAAKEAAISTR
jgi:uncharacterized protein (TIGR02646 family)